MKDKGYKILVSFLILIIICLSIKIVFLLKNKKLIVKIEKLDDHIYHYQIDREEDQYIPINIYKNNIYYMIEEDKVYTLYKRSIYSDKTNKIGVINNDIDYCSFQDNYILCSKPNNGYDYYNLDLKLIYSKPYDKDTVSSTIIYKGKFLELKGTKLYENDKLFKELKLNEEDVYFNSDIIIGNNTYLVFITNDREYLYYNISSDTYEMQENPFWSLYNEGYYTIRVNELLIYDVLHNKNKNYDNLPFDDNTYTYRLSNNNFYFIKGKKLYSIDLDNRTIDQIEYKFDNSIDLIINEKNYIYLISSDNQYEIYVIDINKVNKTSYTFDEFEKYMNEVVDNKVKELEDKYHINIVYKNDVNIDNDTFKANKETNNFTILDALYNLEEVANKFNIEFFDKFHDDDHKGLIIYLTGSLFPNDGVDTASNPIGYAMRENDEYEMAVDINHSGLKGTLCHELMHNIQYRIGIFPYDEWYKKNPKNFSYEYSYTTNASDKYTTYEDDPNKVYFVDSYSKTYTTEDIARVFENICNVEKDSKLLDYPHLYEKGIYLKEIIEKEFPSLKNSTVFNSLIKAED